MTELSIPSAETTSRSNEQDDLFDVDGVEYTQQLESLYPCSIAHALDILQSVGNDAVIYNLVVALEKEFKIKHKSLEAKFFDPFKPYQHSADLNANSSRENFHLNKEDLIRKDINTTLQVLSVCLFYFRNKSQHSDNSQLIDDWHPKITKWGNSLTNLKNENDDEVAKPTPALIMKMYNVGENNNFKSVSKTELSKLKQQCELLQRNPIVQIKIRLSNTNMQLVLQVPPRTNIGHMRKQIQTILSDSLNLNDWYLTLPHAKDPLQDSQTLLQSDLIGKVILHLIMKRSNLQFGIQAKKYHA
ncbi:Ubiquitin-like domain superfamily [Babesia duncani]|uniref:Ubiquitin-like domain superfamily n=1 Tax=Babesia duncani TaxID=323732 RepID=A0AAD9PK16_9APIC|nr:Ubiquitin-like domain superfamily [Babesia duncani]